MLYILGAFLLFLFALDLMVSSLRYLGKDIVEIIIQATRNPFTGLFIGLLVTAMIQSSSTTTAVAVALVASGSLELESAVPIIMGANIGTTITSTIVSLAFIHKRKEFRRAVAAGTYHCFFNLLTVVILFPLEYYYRFLSNFSSAIASYFFDSDPAKGNPVTHMWSGFDLPVDFVIRMIPNGLILIILSFTLLFVSILLFRRIISGLLEAGSPHAFSKFFFTNQLKSFLWGVLTTAAIRSSTVTTSVVVPIVAKKIVSLRHAAPFIMGANIGTTITAFIAATLNYNTSSAISIAIAHFLFNLIGVIIFFPIPALRNIPMGLASGLGRITLKYRLAGLVFLLLTFFFIPFSLIYFNQHAVSVLNLTYEQTSGNEKSYYRLNAKINPRNQSGDWTKFEGRTERVNEEPSVIYPVYAKGNALFIGEQMYLFNKPGSCWDGENNQGKFRICTEQIIPRMQIAGINIDSVYVCEMQYTGKTDLLRQRIYLSELHKIIVRREVLNSTDSVVLKEELIGFKVQ